MVDSGPYVDPELEPRLQEMRARMAERGPLHEFPVAVQRELMTADLAPLNENPPALAAVVDQQVPASDTEIAVRFYYPMVQGTPQPALVFLHGGGWVVGDLDTHDRLCRELALASSTVVVAVNYRLAPEHPFPVPLDDCSAVARWIYEHCDSISIDKSRIAIGGESAGANLALATAMRLRDRGDNWLRFCLLCYGAFDYSFNSESHRLYGDSRFGLSTENMRYFWTQYAKEGERQDPCLSPGRGNFASLPATLLVAAELDPLRDDSITLQESLREQGVDSRLCVYPGVNHGFLLMAPVLKVAQSAIGGIASALRVALNVED